MVFCVLEFCPGHKLGTIWILFWQKVFFYNAVWNSVILSSPSPLFFCIFILPFSFTVSLTLSFPSSPLSLSVLWQHYSRSEFVVRQCDALGEGGWTCWTCFCPVALSTYSGKDPIRPAIATFCLPLFTNDHLRIHCNQSLPGRPKVGLYYPKQFYGFIWHGKEQLSKFPAL